MKRHPWLQELSREHHHGLLLAKRARRWATEGAAARERRWEAVRAAYEAELRPHFEEEEERVLALLSPREHELAARTLADHEMLRRLALHGSTARELDELGALLGAHIRFEERELFPAVESALGQRTRHGCR